MCKWVGLLIQEDKNDNQNTQISSKERSVAVSVTSVTIIKKVSVGNNCISDLKLEMGLFPVLLITGSYHFSVLDGVKDC